ncbi:ABC transporter substrate-binding protein [Bifidobacterium oedipodis]|uniref:Substrate-binding transport protein n=1 Tax=Bifidobacterium oedipodis TaxID=2675322 RepID=A0A7Y0HTH3_9BIFI|nr:extracellular solute-binding protein [Bifidobacterium sp. DSM 109957]NMM94112.1 substrate-binding transport protein [Bifidobacterium sp. DSM 109957]
MKSWKTLKNVSAAILAGALTVSMAACGNTADTTAGDTKSDGPVEIEIWSWDKNGQNVVDAFNKSQDEVKAKFVLQASNTAIQQNFRNAFKAESGLPDYVQGFAPLTTNVANGWAEDISESIKSILGDYTDAAKSNAQLDGTYYGFPTVGSGQFSLINTDVKAKYGVEDPKTWDEVLELGKKAQADGVKVFNLAGEDPSVLEALAQEAGANWFQIDGDQWKVNFLDKGTLKAADVIQQMIDGDMVSNQTYKDRPSLYSFFDSGNLAFMTTQYWSINGYKTNMPNTSGKWEPFEYPAIDDSGSKTPGIVSQVAFVPAGTDRTHQDAVMKYIHFTNTEEGIEAGRDPETKTTGVPQGRSADTIDIDKYIKANIPENFYSDDDKAFDVVKNATETVLGEFNLGPNYDAWFPELQDQWGKAVAKQQTVKQALENTQQFVADDLKSKGINYTIG